MQVLGLQAAVYRGARLASRLGAETSAIAASRRDVLRRFERARRDGLTAEAAARAVGVSRATLHRWSLRLEPRSRRPLRVRRPSWSSALLRATEALRRDYPMWGKLKLGPLLRAEGHAVSDATVGRILKRLTQRGRIDPVARLRRRPYGRRCTPKRRHALRLPRGLKADRPGGLVQIDTVFLNLTPNKAIKHFTAYCPVARWTVGQAFGRATARTAAAFLDKLIAEAPFTVKAIQVDGGSEFKAQFEQACADKGLTLYVLPPKRPQLNGAVERCNGAWRYEFYGVYELPTTIEQLNPLIDGFARLYNHFRPHGALDGRTPAQHLAQLQAAETPPSHMC